MNTMIVATKNKNKVKEIAQIVEPLHLSVITMEEAGIDVEIIEDGATFADNALIKARTVAAYTDQIVLADDSGLEVDAMDGAPGVLSARFMGEDTSYDIKNRAILDKLEGLEGEQRSARYVCAMAAVLHDGREFVITKTMEGTIAYEPAGENGFGYDPIFYVPEKQQTAAQLLPEEKNAISHRGKALRALREELEVILSS